MTTRTTVQTERHGALVVDVDEVPEGDGHGRTWRAVLVDAPARLGHLTAVWAEQPEDVADAVRRAADRYGSSPVVPRWPQP